jgi:hypothetical protein
MQQTTIEGEKITLKEKIVESKGIATPVTQQCARIDFDPMRLLTSFITLIAIPSLKFEIWAIRVVMPKANKKALFRAL